jgi:hypothetical protein
MKKLILFTVLMLAFISLPALDVDLGLQLGLRTATGKIQDNYGSGMVFYPNLKLNVWKGLGIGLGYELGYKKDAKIGIYEENSTLKVSGFEAFAAWEFAAGKLAPYVRLGVGSYTYTQTIESEHAQGVDDSKAAVSIGAGAKYLLGKLFLSAELKYVPLKVQPLTEKVDLGGLRLLAGIGYRLGK